MISNQSARRSMKTLPPLTTQIRALAVASVLFHIAAASQAALVPPLTLIVPGVALAPGISFAGDASLAGTVVGDMTTAFNENVNVPPLFTGNLRSLVVRRADNQRLDFYLQLTNTTPAIQTDSDIFRLVTTGFFPDFATTPFGSYQVSYRTDGLAGITGARAFVVGTKAPWSADRHPAIARCCNDRTVCSTINPRRPDAVHDVRRPLNQCPE